MATLYDVFHSIHTLKHKTTSLNSYHALKKQIQSTLQWIVNYAVAKETVNIRIIG